MRKAKLGIQSGEVTSVIRNYAVEVQTDSKGDLEEKVVLEKVRRAMGANCKSGTLCFVCDVFRARVGLLRKTGWRHEVVLDRGVILSVLRANEFGR